MVYLHFPSNLTEEELMLQAKYNKLKRKVYTGLLFILFTQLIQLQVMFYCLRNISTIILHQNFILF